MPRRPILTTLTTLTTPLALAILNIPASLAGEGVRIHFVQPRFDKSEHFETPKQKLRARARSILMIFSEGGRLPPQAGGGKPWQPSWSAGTALPLVHGQLRQGDVRQILAGRVILIFKNF